MIAGFRRVGRREVTRPGGHAVHVAIEATRFVRDSRGIGRYVRAIVPRLVTQRPDVTGTLFVRGPHQAARARDWIARCGAASSRLDVRPIRDLRDATADVSWYPWNHADPLPRAGPIVVTIHDVAPLAMPDRRLTALFRNILWRRRYSNAAKDAAIIITVSEFTATEVARLLHVSRQRIRVTHLGADIAGSGAHADASERAALGVTQPYVLTVGSDDRRKDLETARRGVARVVSAGTVITLVQAGARRRRNRDTADLPWIRPLGSVGDSALAALYRGAEALIVPSVYEGFGLPVVEAMQLGTPVICSRAASLPEVAGEAAAWFEPGDDVELARVLTRVLHDPATAEQMRNAGRRQAQRFSWDATARATLEAFDAAITLGRNR